MALACTECGRQFTGTDAMHHESMKKMVDDYHLVQCKRCSDNEAYERRRDDMIAYTMCGS